MWWLNHLRCYREPPRQSSFNSHLHLGGESPSNSRVKGPNQEIKNYKPSQADRHKSGTRLNRHRGELNEKKVSQRQNFNNKKTSLVRSVVCMNILPINVYFINKSKQIVLWDGLV